MASTAGLTRAGVSRVTIVAPKTRIDVALPADVPLAILLPTLLRYAGEGLADEGAPAGGWVLSRLGGPALDSGQSAGQLDIRDGEVLYFAPPGGTADEMVFDDVVDAVATATQTRAGRWQTGTTRRFSVVVAALALLGGAAVMLFAGPPLPLAAGVCLVVALALIVCGSVLARAFGQVRSSLVLALVALVYGGVGGLLVLAGNRSLGQLASVHVVLAATAVVVYAALATVAVGHSTGLFIGMSGAGSALGIGGSLCLFLGTPPAGAAAVVAALAFALFPTLPMLAYRLARLPVPAIPSGPDDLKADTDTVEGLRILAQSERADEYLTGLLGTVALIVLGAEVVLGLAGTLAAAVLGLLVALLLMLRARPLSGQLQRLPLLVAGAAGLGVTVVGFAMASSPLMRLTVIPAGLLVVAVAALVYGLGVAGRQISPVWGRLLDATEILMITLLIPVAAWVCGLYAWIRAIHR